MEKVNAILDKEIERIKPSPGERAYLDKKISEIISILNKRLKGKADAVLGGSFAKDTVIKKDRYDADVFVRFKNEKNISEILEKVLKAEKLKAEKVPGSRDYFKIKINNISLEIVPILSIKKPENALNVTDVSPLHTEYIKKQIFKKKSLADEIRLAKAFCYAIGCYGAESHIRGFSGYCLEVLVSYYKSFLNLARETGKWTIKNKTVLDPEKYYKSKEEILRELNESKLISPLVLVDPVQKNRNVAAALSDEKFMMFIEACRKFISRPSSAFFEKKAPEAEILSQAKKSKKELLIVDAESMKDKEDIAGAKLLKFCNFLLEKLKREGYTTKSAIKFNENSAKFYILLDKKDLLVPGPFIDMKKHAENFMKKWKTVNVKNKRLFAVKKKSEISWKNALKIDEKSLKEMAVRKFSFRIQSKI